MAMNSVEVGTVTSDVDGHFLWNTGRGFISLLETSQVSFDSPSFDFGGAKWLLSIAKNKTTYGWLGVSFRNEILSQMPRLAVNVGVESGWRVKEKRHGTTDSSGRFNALTWLRTTEAMRNKWIFTEGPFVIFCKLQILDVAPNNVFLPESPRDVAINSTSEKKESKEGDISRFFRRLKHSSEGERRPLKSTEIKNEPMSRFLGSVASISNLRVEERREEDQSGLQNNVAINSNSRKEESKEDDKSRLLKNLLSLSDNLKQLFQSGEGCDVTLIVKDKQLQAHSAILQARSIVFSSMMTHDMVEKSSREVRIDDCEPGAIQELLHFLYTGKVENLTEDNMQHVYYAGDKYEVADLKSECVEFMKMSLTTKVVCEVIVLAAKHSEPDLLACATEYFIKNIDEVLETVQWHNFLQEHPTEANELYIKALKKIRT